ncbi:MAG: hypothetical protein QM820_11125 [Minicystis sp.]
MIVVLILGAGAIGFGVKALGKPTAERIAVMQSLPGLIAFASLWAFGTNMWAVNQHVGSEAFLKAKNITEAEAPFMALIGVTESVQVFTLAGVLAMAVVALRIVAEARAARVEAKLAAEG